MTHRDKSKFIQRPVAQFETTDKHLKDKVFVLKLIPMENEFVVWGYDVINERKAHLGAYSEVSLLDAEIQSISIDPKDKATWVFFNHRHRIDKYMPGKPKVLRVRKP